MTPAARVRVLDPIREPEIAGLCDVLVDCVKGGASVSFMLPLPRTKAEIFWRDAAASVARGERVVLAAEDERGIVGTVQVTASAEAERLYVRRGWQRVGKIPRYALLPDGAPCATTVCFKALAE